MFHKLIYFWIIFFLPHLLTGYNGNAESIILNLKSEGNSKVITIAGNSTSLITATEIPLNASAIILQAHSHVYNLTMHDQRQASIHHRVTGQNIGMLIKLQDFEPKSVWLTNKSPKSVSVLVIFSVLHPDEPLPGDCNMEFSTETAPYLVLKSDKMRYFLEYQHARLGSGRNKSPFTCSFSSIYVTYDIYISFLAENDFSEEEYFKKIRLMSDLSSLKQLSSKAESYSLHPDTRFYFLKYPNLGVIYNVVAKYTLNGQVREVPYIPVASYGCNLFDFTESGCRLSYTVEGRIILFILSIYGFAVAFFGYLFVGPVIFFFALLGSFFTGLVLLGKYGSFSLQITVIIALVVGIFGAGVCLSLWVLFHNQLLLLLLNGFVLGFLLSAVVFFTPIGNLEIFVNSMNFWAMLSSGTLFIAVLALIFPNLMTIFGSSVVGCYTLILFYDDFVGTRLSYIILNIIKRAFSDKSYFFALNDLPFQTKDIIMCLMWIVLSLISAVIWTKKLSDRNQINCRCCFPQKSSSQHTTAVYANQDNDKARQPLLVENRNVYYQTF